MATTAARRTNWFAIGVTAAVVVVIVVIAAIVMWGGGAGPGSEAAPESTASDSGAAQIDAETGAISVGDGPDEVTVWFDFFCPHCQDFEDLYGPTLAGLVGTGDITLHLQPVALPGLNAASGTDFSARSASALYCVAEGAPDAALPFMTAVFAVHPAGAGLTDDELVALAEEAGATGTTDCIRDASYAAYALSQAGEIPANPATGSAGTPTVLVGGEHITLTGDVAADITDRLAG